MIGRSHLSGFTLIELSIVLVIIGLIAGGVLVGRSLIEASENRKVVSYNTEFATAWNTFKLKYNCIPGDCANATNFFGTISSGFCPASARTAATGTCNGDGNKKITWSSGTAEGTYGFAFDHLYEAKMLQEGFNGSTIYIYNTPIKSARGFIGSNGAAAALYAYAPFNQQTGNALQFAIVQNFSPTQPIAAFISPRRLLDIDTKSDDGKPGSGNLVGGNGQEFGTEPAVFLNCVSNATGTYEYLVSDDITCRFQYKLD